MVGARGFEPPTPWSRTGVSKNLRPCRCRTYEGRHPKNPASIGPQVGPQPLGPNESSSFPNDERRLSETSSAIRVMGTSDVVGRVLIVQAPTPADEFQLAHKVLESPHSRNPDGYFVFKHISFPMAFRAISVTVAIEAHLGAHNEPPNILTARWTGPSCGGRTRPHVRYSAESSWRGRSGPAERSSCRRSW
jgi:hypothetical protein